MSRFCVIFFSVPLLSLLPSGAEDSAPKPNIILIMADDMGWSDIGCFGGEIPTPNIDRIANEGMRFTQFYNNGKCTTTRASLLTGLYPRKGGRGQELLTPNMQTLGEVLAAAGYQTGLSGKWHNGNKAPHRPIDRGFQSSYGLWDGCCNFFSPAIADPNFKGGRTRFFGQNDERITEFPDDFFTTVAFTDHAIATIKKHAANEKPFFHYIAHTAPHYPLHATPEDIARHEGLYDAGWESLREKRYQRQVEMGLIDPAVHPKPGMNKGNIGWAEIPDDRLDYETLRMEVYAAMVDRMDREIGRVLDALGKEGIADNTLIIFLSDNGGCAEQPGGRTPEQIPGPKDFYSHCGPDWAWAQNTPFRRYKSTTYEGGIATPMVARWPKGIEAGQITDQVGHIIDFLPTFLELAGGEYPNSVKGNPVLLPEGISLAPVLTGKSQTIERKVPLFWHWSGNRAVRNKNWKIVWEKGKDAKWQIYNLANDRTETKDLADKHSTQIQLLSRKWEAWATQTGVKF
jgi:arylsulfatase